MGEKSRKALVVFAIGLLGFVLGVIANVIYTVALPALMEVFPYILSSSWIAWGLIGAMIAIACGIIYACMPP